MARKERGVAIMLVLFLVVLTTTLVTTLARSTYLGGRVNSSIERGLRAEYLVKSALSVAQVLLEADKTPHDDPADLWKLFTNGVAVPVEYLGIDEPNVNVELEITPLGAKFPMSSMLDGQQPKEEWINGFIALCKSLQLEDPDDVEEDGPFKGVVFSCEDLAANYLDYVDENTDPVNLTTRSFSVSGREDSTFKDYFPNHRLNKDEELANIPGFTPARVQTLLQYVTVNKDIKRINANSASEQVLSAMLDPMQKDVGQELVNDRETNKRIYKSTSEISDLYFTSKPDLAAILDIKSERFTVIAKVDLTTVVSFLKATVRTTGTGNPVAVQDVQIY